MNHTSPAFLLLAVAQAILFSIVVAAIAFSLARWDGATVPAALTRSGVAFAAGLTLCLAVLSPLDRYGFAAHAHHSRMIMFGRPMGLGVMVGLDGLAAHHGHDAGQQGLGLEHSVPGTNYASIAFDGAVSR